LTYLAVANPPDTFHQLYHTAALRTGRIDSSSLANSQLQRFHGLGSVVALTDGNGPRAADPDLRLGVGQAVARYEYSVLRACGVLLARGG